MAMPSELVLVRHGKSEGNVAKKRSKQGDHSAYLIPEFAARHDSQFRLVDKGREEGGCSGAWIKNNLRHTFYRYIVSPFIRALEMAACLDLPGALWLKDYNMRERCWGDLDNLSEDEQQERFADAMDVKREHPFLWTPPNGESMAQVCLRVDRTAQTLHRECDGQPVIIVSHGETMWAWRIILERLTPEMYLALDRSDDPRDRINNGHILIYSRINPHTKKLEPYLNWMRSISPSNPEASRDEWRRIIRPKFTNEQLLDIVQRVPQLIL